MVRRYVDRMLKKLPKFQFLGIGVFDECAYGRGGVHCRRSYNGPIKRLFEIVLTSGIAGIKAYVKNPFTQLIKDLRMWVPAASVSIMNYIKKYMPGFLDEKMSPVLKYKQLCQFVHRQMPRLDKPWRKGSVADIMETTGWAKWSEIGNPNWVLHRSGVFTFGMVRAPNSWFLKAFSTRTGGKNCGSVHCRDSYLKALNKVVVLSSGRRIKAGCAAEFKVRYRICNTCCCRHGLARTSLNNKLTVGSLVTCGAWFAQMDAFIRSTMALQRSFSLTLSFVPTCWRPTAIPRDPITRKATCP